MKREVQTREDPVASPPDCLGFQSMLTTIILLIWLEVATSEMYTSRSVKPTQAVSSAIVFWYFMIKVAASEIKMQCYPQNRSTYLSHSGRNLVTNCFILPFDLFS